jgi:hypothetical protein
MKPQIMRCAPMTLVLRAPRLVRPTNVSPRHPGEATVGIRGAGSCRYPSRHDKDVPIASSAV